jgi:hypothetical protein
MAASGPDAIAPDQLGEGGTVMGPGTGPGAACHTRPDRDGAWTTAKLCRAAYPGLNRVDKKHRNAVSRALRTMALPGTWTVRRLHRPGVEYCLHDACSDASQILVSYMEDSGRHRRRRESFERWKEDRSHIVDKARGRAAEARRWRD